MKIKWLKHPSCPELNNTIEHVSRSVADIAIGFRQAEYIPFKNAVERLNYESSLLASKPATVGWGIKESDGSNYSQNLIIKTIGSDVIYYDAPTADTPPAIVARFAQAQLKSSAAQRLANDAERQRAYADKERDKLAELNGR